MIKNSNISIYFDGLYPLCSREIEHYKKQKGSENFRFIDITHPEFNAEKEGLDPVRVHKVMHVKTQEGQLITGLDAFICIWEFLPKYYWISKLANKTIVKSILNIGYQTFAVIRPYLPRKKSGCNQSPFCESHSHFSKKNQ